VELGSGQWVAEDRQAAAFERIDPARVKSSGGHLFAEFERGAVGLLEFYAFCSKKDTVVVHLGERREGDTVHKDPGITSIGYTKCEIELKPGFHRYAVEVPRRDIKGYLHSQKLAPHLPEVVPFRFVEIENLESGTRISGLQQAALYYPFDESSSQFISSDANLNAVWSLCRYTQKAAPFLGIYADGNRERMPYEADAYIQMLSHFATDREYAIARYTIEFLLSHASWPTEWQLHMPLMAWAYYEQTGDANPLRSGYETLKVKALVELTESNGLISARTGLITQDLLDRLGVPSEPPGIKDIVDWPPGRPEDPEHVHAYHSNVPGGERDNFVFTDYNAVVNAFHNRALQSMARIAEAIGKEEDSRFFTERAAAHADAFNQQFWSEDKGLYTDGPGVEHASLHANMFPLAFGLVPPERVEAVARYVESRGMACSVYGAQYLLESLYAAGREQAALDLMRSEDRRSWMNMIRVGATITTEAWDEFYKPNLTWNHAWGSAPANIIVRKLAGIEPIDPGFGRFRIQPQPGDLAEFSLRAPTPRGQVGVQFQALDKQWSLTIEVPGNSECELRLPERFRSVSLNGTKHDTATPLRLCAGRHQVVAR
jgi:hypothetical protein